MHPRTDVLTLVPDLWAAGLERVALDVVEGTCARFRQCVVRFAPAHTAPEHPPSGFAIETIYRRPGFDFRFIGALAGCLRRHRPRVLHAHNPTALFYGSLAARFAPRVSILYTDHAQETPLSPRGATALRLVRHRQTTAIAVAHHLARRLIENDGWPRQRVRVIPNGVRPHTKSPRPGAPSASGTLRVGVVARVSEVKDHATILRALAMAAPRVPGVSLDIIGDGPLRSTLEDHALALGLGDRVRFMGRRTDVARRLDELDLFVTASRSEGLPLAALEAMVAGCPIACSDIPAHREILEDGVSALFFPIGDAKALAERIVQAAEAPTSRRELATAAQQAALRSHTTDVMVQSYTEVLEELLT
jgi:glycosyltransferase involved in cell wall biosynthesis